MILIVSSRYYFLFYFISFLVLFPRKCRKEPLGCMGRQTVSVKP